MSDRDITTDDRELRIATRAVRLYAESHPRPTQVTQTQAAEILGVAPMSAEEREALIEALAQTIVSRQGHPHRTRAEFVLEVIEKQGWTLARKDQ